MKKLITVFLTVTMILSVIGIVPFNAAEQTTVDTASGKGSSKAVVSTEAATFSVTVPTVLPIYVDSDNNVTVADNAEISNNCNGPVTVTKVSVETDNKWELAEFSTDFTKQPVNTQKYGMKINDTDVYNFDPLDTGDDDFNGPLHNIGSISGNDSLPITYDCNVALQNKPMTDYNIGHVVFTVAWDSNSATLDRSKCLNYLNGYSSFKKTTENLSIEEISLLEYYGECRRIDDGTTDCCIYCLGGGEWWSNADTVYLPADCSELFAYEWNLETVDLSGFDASKVTNMRGMFCEDDKLTSVNLSGLDTSNVTDMSGMFMSCYQLHSVDLSSFDTSKVTNMSGMFSSCSEFLTLDLSSFDTSNVTDMCNMFYNCFQLQSVDLSSFDTSKVTNMSYMFAGCVNLPTLDLSSFDTSNVTDMSGMFYEDEVEYIPLENLKTIYVSDFNTDSLSREKTYMFDCPNLVGGNGTKFDSSNPDAYYSTYACIDTPETPGYFTYKAKAA